MSIQNPANQLLTDEIKPTKQRFITLLILLIGIMVVYLDRVNVSVLAANGTFLTDMGIQGQPVKIGMMMSTFLFAYGFGNLLLSPLGDYWGPRKTVTLALVLCCISIAMGGMAGTFTVLIASRIILGIGEGAYYPMSGIFTKNWFPPQERGRANAAWIIGQSLAPAAAMPFFTYIIGTYGWRESFHAALVLTIIPLVLFWLYITDRPKTHKKVNALELRHIEEGLAREKKNEDSGIKETLWQRVKPFITNYRYWLLVYWYISLNFVFWGMVSWLPSYLKTARGFSWSEMGWLSALPFLAAIITKAFAGWVADRTGRCAPILCAAMVLGGLGTYLAVIAPGKYMAAALLIISFGFGNMAAPAAWTLLQGLVDGKSLATAGGTMNAIAAFCSSTSPVLIGWVISSTGSYDGGLFMLVGAALLASGAAAVLALQKL